MDMIDSGYLNKSISLRLDLNVKSVESHRKNINRKTRTRCVAELARFICETQQHDRAINVGFSDGPYSAGAGSKT